MDRIFGIDSPFMRTLGVIADLMLLNVLTILFSLPVITAGAAFTALHYCCLKINRGEETYITRMFLRSFKQNFLQSVPLCLMFLLMAAGYILDLRYANKGVIPGWFFYAGTVAILLFVYVFVWVFPLLSRFDNTTGATIKNALIVSITKFPRTLAMLAVTAVFAFLCNPVTVGPVVFIRALPVIFLFSFSAPAYICAKIYDPVFRSLEEGLQQPEADPADQAEATLPDPSEGPLPDRVEAVPSEKSEEFPSDRT